VSDPVKHSEYTEARLLCAADRNGAGLAAKRLHLAEHPRNKEQSLKLNADVRDHDVLGTEQSAEPIACERDHVAGNSATCNKEQLFKLKADESGVHVSGKEQSAELIAGEKDPVSGNSANNEQSFKLKADERDFDVSGKEQAVEPVAGERYHVSGNSAVSGPYVVSELESHHTAEVDGSMPAVDFDRKPPASPIHQLRNEHDEAYYTDEQAEPLDDDTLLV
jgi:hypothetical protein